LMAKESINDTCAQPVTGESACNHRRSHMTYEGQMSCDGLPQSAWQLDHPC